MTTPREEDRWWLYFPYILFGSQLGASYSTQKILKNKLIYLLAGSDAPDLMEHLTSLDTDVSRYRRHGVIPCLFLNLSNLFPHLSREILPLSIPSFVGWKLKATVTTSYSLCCPLWPQDCLQPAGLSPFLHCSCRWPPRCTACLLNCYFSHCPWASNNSCASCDLGGI